MKPISIRSQWDRFERDVMPDKAGPVQRQEMRRAFYAGASIMLKLTHKAAIEMDEVAATNYLEELDEELKEFLTDMIEGRA